MIELCRESFLRSIIRKKRNFKALLKHYGIKKVIGLVTGGEERQDSVYHGVKVTNRMMELS